MPKTITILSCKDNFSGYTEFEYEMPLADFKKEYKNQFTPEELAEIIDDGTYDERDGLRSR